MNLSVIIPCFNEANTILKIVELVKKSPVNLKEIIIIDDFSTDSTRELLQELNDEIFKIIYQPRNMGKSETGSKAAAPIWINFMKNAVANLPTEQFPQPPGITTIKVHKSGRRATACDNNEDIHEEHYKFGSEPVLDLSVSGNCMRAVKSVEKGIEETETEL